MPFSPTQTVVDPIFGRDISFFLFELPFFRLVQSLVNGLLLASLVVAGARYLLATTRGGEVFVTRVRVHLAVLGGLYLLSVAFGYQLDKYELVYSQAGVATGRRLRGRQRAVPGLRRPDVPVGARRGPADRGRVHPLDVAAGASILIVWFSASIVLGRLYPEAIQRLSVDPNTYAQEAAVHREQHRDDAPRVRARPMGQSRSYGGAAPLTEEAIQSEADTFTNARLWDYRPLQTTLDQLQAVRQYYDFHDVDTDRYMIDGTLRQVMLSGRELAIEQGPGRAQLGQPADHLDPRDRRRDGARQRGHHRGPADGCGSATCRRCRTAGRPRSRSRGSTSARADSHYVVVRAQPAGVRLSRATRARASGDPTTSWTGQTGIPLDSTLSRLLFALRFRDFDLLITDQVTADSQLLFHRTLSERLGWIAPFLRFDKDPYLVVDGRPARLRPGRVHDQRPFPERDAVRHARASAADVGPARRRGHQLHPQQRQDHDGRLRRHDALLRRATRPTR